MLIEYDGTSYRGWQDQTNAKTIQGTLIKTAEHVLECKVDIQGAGRTDAGVHAFGQVAHMETQQKLSLRSTLEKMNDALPSNINIRRIEEAKPSFHARHDAKGRSYLYFISEKRTAFGKRYVWWVKDRLDLKMMQETIALFKGFHDFSSFADKRRNKSNSSLVKIEFSTLQKQDSLLIFRFAGSHFLWKMIRRLVGITVETGRGNLTVHDVRTMLKTTSDIPAQYTAPPSGLFLEQVLYEGETWQPYHLPLWTILTEQG